MFIKYHLIGRVDPRDPALPKKFYANIQNGEEVSFDDLIQLVSQYTSQHEGDIVAVLITLLNVMKEQLASGKPVVFGDFGTFYMTINSDGTTTKDAFVDRDIKQARIRFRPGARLRKMLKTLHFEQVAPPGDGGPSVNKMSTQDILSEGPACRDANLDK